MPYTCIMSEQHERIEIRQIEKSIKEGAKKKAKSLNLSLTAYITHLIIKDIKK